MNYTRFAIGPFGAECAGCYFKSACPEVNARGNLAWVPGVDVECALDGTYVATESSFYRRFPEIMFQIANRHIPRMIGDVLAVPVTYIGEYFNGCEGAIIVDRRCPVILGGQTRSGKQLLKFVTRDVARNEKAVS